MRNFLNALLAISVFIVGTLANIYSAFGTKSRSSAEKGWNASSVIKYTTTARPAGIGSDPLRAIPRWIAALLSPRCVTIDRPGPSYCHVFPSRHSTASRSSCAELPANHAIDSSVARNHAIVW